MRERFRSYAAFEAQMRNSEGFALFYVMHPSSPRVIYKRRGVADNKGTKV